MSQSLPNMRRSFQNLDRPIEPSPALRESLRQSFASQAAIANPIWSPRSLKHRRLSKLGRWLAVAAMLLISVIAVLEVGSDQNGMWSAATIDAPYVPTPEPLTIPPGFDLPVRSLAWDKALGGVGGPVPSGAYSLQWSVSSGVTYGYQALLYGPNAYHMEAISTSASEVTLVANSVEAGAELWRTLISNDGLYIGTPYGIVTTIRDAEIPADLRIALLDHESGTPRWISDTPYDRTLNLQLEVAEDTIVFANSSGFAAGVNLADGTQRWTYSPPPPRTVTCTDCVSQMLVNETAVFLLNDTHTTLTAVDTNTGVELWSVDAMKLLRAVEPDLDAIRSVSLNVTATGPLLNTYSRLGSNKGPRDLVVQLSASTGEPVWKWSNEKNTSFSYMSLEDRVMLVTNNRIEIIDAATGATLVDTTIETNATEETIFYLSEAGVVVSQGSFGPLHVWDPETLQLAQSVDVDSCLIVFPINPDGSLLCYRQSDSSLGYYTPQE